MSGNVLDVSDLAAPSPTRRPGRLLAELHAIGERRRRGKVLILFAVSMPAILAIVGLVFDAGMLITTRQNLQQAADAAATAAAMDLLLGYSSATAMTTATTYMETLNNFPDAELTTNIPPQSGPYVGQTGFVEVLASTSYKTQFMQIVGAAPQSQVSVRSVAGYEASTASSAVIVLDPTPQPVAIGSIPSLSLPSYPALLGGLEILGLGNISVNGAVLDNNTWGGVDQNGNPAGSAAGPPYGMSCTPLLSTTKLLASNIRVAGGVDSQNNYGNVSQGQTSPLVCNALAVTDPFAQTATPCTASDPANVSATYQGTAQVIQLPFLTTTTLNPGVYDWIEIISGTVVFTPGVYIIRSVNPTTGVALAIAGGTVTANGVLFYLTNSTFDASSGAPDSSDGSTRPGEGNVTTLPSVAITSILPGSTFSGLASPGSPFNGMLIYQRRQDLRPIAIVAPNLLGTTAFQGVVYAKWAQFLFSGGGTLNLSIAAGTIRFVQLGGLTITPMTPMPPAKDVYLVE